MSNLLEHFTNMSPLHLALAAQKQAPGRAVTNAEPIAVIGMGCRFPGGVETPEALWQILHDGGDLVTEIPLSRWDMEQYYDPNPDAVGKMATRHGSFLSQVDQFDPTFFGIAPREAKMMDPQQRLLLEVSWEAIERSGIDPTQLRGTQTGVFVGMMSQDYAQLSTQTLENIDTYTGMGALISAAAGRIAYLLGLHGPTLTVDTACSSSLVALHLACQSLHQAECEMALVGGVNVILTPQLNIMESRLHVFAANGRCKAFDAAADGMVRGEGCGVVVLKRLSDAIAQGDPILALIRGTAVNHDGRSSGLTVPNGPAQERVIRQALENGFVSPQQVSYVETHGTGTALGDPIEAGALEAVYGANRQAPLLLGSIKTNMGHLEGAAGIAGFMKAVLALQHGEIPPNLHFRQPNPYIPWQTYHIEVPTTPRSWPTQGRRLAGVSSFGMSGTNAHIVLEAAPNHASAKTTTIATERAAHLFTLSAKTSDALTALAHRYLQSLADSHDLTLADLCFTTHSGRTHFDYRLSVVATSISDLREKLNAFVQGEAISTCATAQRSETDNKLAFLFTGQGAQYVGMGRELYKTAPVFRAILDRCETAWQAQMGRSLLALIYPPAEADSRDTPVNDLMESHPCGQAVNFALECALAELWKSWGIVPDYVLGHSLGDFAAAYTAGVISLEDGLRLVTLRGQLMERAQGEMISVLAGEEQVLPYLAGEATVAIAVINGPQNIVLTGASDAIQRINNELTTAGFRTRKLAIPVAAHSPLLDPVLEEFEAVVRGIRLSPPKLSVVSSMSGKIVGHELTDPVYWRRHLRNTVRFADGVQTLYAQGCTCFLEIGPKATLLGMAEQVASGENLPTHLQPATCNLPSLREGQSDWIPMLTALGELYVQGVAIEWQGVDKTASRRKVLLPTYPFQRQRYWVDTKKTRSTATLRPLIDRMIRLPSEQKLLFESEYSLESLPFLADHRVYDTVVSPGACQLAMVLQAGEEALGHTHFQLQDVILPQALVIPATESRIIQVVLTSPPSNKQGVQREFKLTSHAAAAGDSEFGTHAVGMLLERHQAATPAIDLLALRQNYPQTVDLAAFYTEMKRRQIELGASFRWIEELRQTSNGEGAFAKLSLPDAVGSVQGYTLHPGLLDACFQVVGTILQARNPGETLLPFAFDQLHLAQAASGESWWCQVREAGAQKWQLDLFNAQGQLIMQIDGFQTRAATIEAIRGSDAWRDWLYMPEWQPRPRSDTPSLQQSSGQKWVLFADEGGVGDSLAQELSKRGGEPILVYAKDAYQQVDDSHFGVRHAVAEDYYRLFSTIKAVDHVVYLWGLENQSESALDTEQSCGCLLYLVQALLAEGREVSALWLVTQASQSVTADEAIAGVGQAALWGMGKVIGLEHPELHPICVDLDQNYSSEEQAKILCAEMVARVPNNPLETQVALRGSNAQMARYVTRLQRFVPQPTPPLTIRADATYLITGGLGGLGLATAEWLAAQGARQLVLLGRRPPQLQAQTTIATLQAQGVTVTVAQADVTNRTALQSVFDAIDRHCALAGIIHAAGHLHDAALFQQSWQAFAEVLAPKVQGAWHLHHLSKGLTLDFFVLFSSATSLLGNAGQANHAAANAFLDAFAHYRRAQGMPAQSINWGAWSEIGAAAEMMHDKRHLLAEQGIGALSPQQGLAVFAALLTQAAPQVGVLPIHWSKYLADETRQHPFLAELMQHFSHVAHHNDGSSEKVNAANIREKLAGLPEDERDEQLLHFVRIETAHVLGITEPQSVPLQQPLFEFGIDSLMALQLKNRLQSALQTTLHPTLVFDYPTVGRLTNYLCGTLFNTFPSTTHEKAVTNDKPLQGAEPSTKLYADTLDVAISPEIDQLSGADLLDLINQFGKKR